MNSPFERASRTPINATLLLALALSACGDDGPTGGTIDAAPDIDAVSPTIDYNPYRVSFVDVTRELDDVYMGGGAEVRGSGVGSGAAVADIDGDGDLDMFLARCDGGIDEGGPSVLLRHTGAFPGFESDPAIEAAFAGVCAHGAAFGDYDNDGDEDLYVVLEGPDRLYRNDGAGGFTEVTEAAGVAGPAGDINTSAYWADVNHDGLLDLFVPHHIANAPGPHPINANRLYLNRGDGGFDSIGDAAGVAGDGSTQAAAIADIDADGDLELYLANDQFAVGGQDPGFGLDADRFLDLASYDDQNTPLYVDRSAEYSMDGPRSSMGVAIADVDGDGHDDIYVTDIGTNHLHTFNAATQLYEMSEDRWNLGLRDALLEGELVAWDAQFADLDRDGGLELIVVHGSIRAPFSCADYTQFDNIMRYDPRPDRFVDITVSAGLPLSAACPPQDDRPLSGRGLLLADLDGDHDDDLIVTPYVEMFRFYRNDTPALHHVLRVAPRGTVSAPTPVGAVLEITTVDGQTRRSALYAGGTNTQHAAVLEIGLGMQTSVEAATLHWPSGLSQRLDVQPDFAVDTTLAVTEPAWLTLSARVIDAGQDPPVMTYCPVDETGAFLGAAGAGRAVVMTRSDNLPATVVDDGAGCYSAVLDHPGTARTTVVRVSDDGQLLRPRLSVRYR